MVVVKVWGNFELPGLGVWELDRVWRKLWKIKHYFKGGG